MEQGETVGALALLRDYQSARFGGGASPRGLLNAIHELETRASAGGSPASGGGYYTTPSYYKQ